MKNSFVLALALFAACFMFHAKARAQEYVSPTNPAKTGKSPGVKAQLLSQNGNVKTYMLVFAKGDEILSGLTEFAQKNNITSAHFTAIGDAQHARVGWYDENRKMFKVIPINEPSEITSLVGDIAVYNGKPVVHAHINLAGQDGVVRGGHLLEAYIFPTLEVRLTVEPETMYKKLYPEAGATIIDAKQ
ncbi:DNA-binding protein [Mucilaginibacter sp. Bleaf8]|uniref:PPC domain-containing DNA-binding protein n=1 Tax=Mucilaginibacter sp. Bleaf8 TaxID=2834430 RepID=UPI001BD1BC8D|nr:PPC domain-containing DNA-binding protein [Mucilaginibacter sp. Bleaf8]MBS7566375.1 DNA-binding protein [Mucilaginibacter sp. Bleaf8]